MGVDVMLRVTLLKIVSMLTVSVIFVKLFCLLLLMSRDNLCFKQQNRPHGLYDAGQLQLPSTNGGDVNNGWGRGGAINIGGNV